MSNKLPMTAADVIAGSADWSAEHADCLEWLRAMPADSVDLVVTSPPYSSARQYGELNFSLVGEDWVRWMFSVVEQLSRVCKGPIAIVCDDQTRDYRWGATPFLLAADLHRAGYCLRHPCCYFRFGIPGSGGQDYLRNDWEPILIITRGGKLPWAENTACGHIPKWGPGGEMSHRLKSGARVNKFGSGGPTSIGRNRQGKRMPPGNSAKETILNGPEQPGLFGEIEAPAKNLFSSHSNMCPRLPNGDRRRTKMSENPSGKPAIANPGNVIRQQYDAEAVRQLIAAYVTREIEPGDLIRCLTGGGSMGHALAHENEAPFPLTLARVFVRTFCPPGGVCCDPFLGSGTTLHAAIECGRRGIGCDLRASQVELSRRRLAGLTPSLLSQPTEDK